MVLVRLVGVVGLAGFIAVALFFWTAQTADAAGLEAAPLPDQLQPADSTWLLEPAVGEPAQPVGTWLTWRFSQPHETPHNWLQVLAARTVCGGISSLSQIVSVGYLPGLQVFHNCMHDLAP